ncbi:MAG: dihydrolipoamide acetyltransferase family protein [Pseudomonadota bacterium]
METFSFKLPDLGEGIVESEIVEWHVAVGDLVDEDDLLVDVQTEKAVVEVTAPVSGEVLALGGDPGAILAVGAELVRFAVATLPEGVTAEGANEASAPEVSKSPAERASELVSAAPPERATLDRPSTTHVPAKDELVLASPSLRRRAREAGVDLSDVPAQRSDGRLSHADFERFVAVGAATVSQGPGVHPVARSQPGGLHGSGVTEVRLSGARRVIAKRMQATKRDIPHYSYVEEVDVSQLEALRLHLNEQRDPQQPKLTLLPFLIRGLVSVLGGFPQCNAHFDETSETLSQYGALHIGIATMTPMGLMVPVVRDAQDQGLWELAHNIVAVADKARNGKARPDELRGSTITITSLGALGGIASTPVLNAPETAIIGVNKMQERPMVEDGQVVIRTMMNLSASFDHRVVDGYDGASLVQALRRVLQNPATMFIW